MAFWISQAFVLISYFLCGATFFVKKKGYLLLISTGVCISFSIAYLFEAAYTGIAMNLISLIRNLVFFLVLKYAPNSKKMHTLQLLFILALTATFAVFTYDGLLSLTAVVAAAIYTYAVWEKSRKNYKIYTIVSSLAWIAYNAFVGFILGIVLESVMVICAIIGLIKNSNKGYGEEVNG